MLYGAKSVDPDKLLRENRGTLGVGHELASQLWFFDRFYQDAVVPAAKVVNKTLYYFDFAVLDQILVDGWAYFVRAVARICGDFDNWVVDKLVDACGVVTWMVGSLVRSLQAGRIQYYVCVTFGVVAVVMLALLMM